jgi:hypothetical protein
MDQLRSGEGWEVKRKPFYRKRGWWGWLLGTASTVGLAVVKVPGPVGILLGLAALGTSIAGYSVQEVQRELAIQGAEKAVVLAKAVAAEKSASIPDRAGLDQGGPGKFPQRRI